MRGLKYLSRIRAEEGLKTNKLAGEHQTSEIR
jgi:hypothetical protein